MLPDQNQPPQPAAQRTWRPRHYTAHIISLKTLEERRAAFAQVPEEWRGLVETQVQIAWNHPGRREQ